MLITSAWHAHNMQLLNPFVSFLSSVAPVIVTAPGEVWNVTGSQVFLSCEATGIPTPVLTWRKVKEQIIYFKKSVNLWISRLQVGHV